MRTIVIAVVMSMTLISCGKREQNSQQGGVETATIAPAEGMPAPTGTDAMTQTVEVEGSRPEAEGAGMTDTEPGTTTAGTTAAPVTGTVPVPPPPSRQ